MNAESYNFETSTTSLEFQFFSLGPKGTIKKRVNFTPVGDNVFNIGFGDENVNGIVDDLVVTGNRDSEKVLATVVLTILKFFEKHPHTYLVATGSTASRTRLYQMGIRKNLKEISQLFEVYGFIDSSWEQFNDTKNYSAFLVRQKKIVPLR